MTCAELIKKLAAMPPEMPVLCCEDTDGDGIDPRSPAGVIVRMAFPSDAPEQEHLLLVPSGGAAWTLITSRIGAAYVRR